MSRKMVIIMCLVLALLFCVSVVNAATTEKKDVEIDSEDDTSEILFLATKDDKVDIKVKSDIPVDVYIMESGDYWANLGGDDFSDAKVSKMATTDTSFTFKIPDDQSYHLVIYNPNNATATVDYEYTDYFEERLEESAGFLGMAVGICAVIVIVLIVIVVVIIYFAVKWSKNKNQPPLPPPPPPPQAPPDQKY